jgi:hypothetical protein
MTTTDHDDSNDGEAGSSSVRHIPTAAHSNKRQARPPTDHFKRLLEEAYPNHAYLVRHKLKDRGMMMSFMTSGSLTWAAELIEGPDGSNMTPFPEENVVMMVYEWWPPSGRYRMSKLSPKAQTHHSWGHGGSGL